MLNQLINKNIKHKLINFRGRILKQIDTKIAIVYWYFGNVIYKRSNNSTKFSLLNIKRMHRFYEQETI